MNNKLLLTIVIVVVVVSAIIGIKLLVKSRGGYGLAEASRTKGHPSSSIKVVEYIDLQCPMCAVGAKKLKEYMTQYPDKIYLEMHYFPLEMHKHSFEASQYAECAAQQNKFWEFQDAVLEHQKTWAEATNAVTLFDIYAKEIGLDMKRLKACLPTKAVDELIETSKKDGIKQGIRSTPTYFINGEMVVGIKVLQEKMDQLLGIVKPADNVEKK